MPHPLHAPQSGTLSGAAHSTNKHKPKVGITDNHSHPAPGHNGIILGSGKFLPPAHTDFPIHKAPKKAPLPDVFNGPVTSPTIGLKTAPKSKKHKKATKKHKQRVADKRSTDGTAPEGTTGTVSDPYASAGALQMAEQYGPTEAPVEGGLANSLMQNKWLWIIAGAALLWYWKKK